MELLPIKYTSAKDVIDDVTKYINYCSRPNALISDISSQFISHY